MIQLYNTLTRQIEDFIPIKPPEVSLYVCGVTVYDYCHMGHARAYVVFDLLKRVLTHAGYRVNHVQNFTDIDDKIINKSHEAKIPWKQLTDTYTTAYFDDMKALNILTANQYPKATELVDDMIQLIDTLIQKKCAYAVNGSVYFRVNSCESYGQLSKKDIESLDSGHRVEVEDQKESPLDFILWKPSKSGEPFWSSPWGDGRPGWHTECVAMVNQCLGPHIDIHGGGSDLQFPHHENELAQATCAYHTDFANVWMHNGFVTIDNEKMSKSLKNFFTIRDLLTKYEADVLRFFLMRIHYRGPLHFSMDNIEDAKAAYHRLISVFDEGFDDTVPKHLNDEFEAIKAKFWKALMHDLGISEAIAELFACYHLIRKHRCGVSVLKELGQAIGLFYKEKADIPQDILDLAEQRWQAKQAKDYVLADQLRQQIEGNGYSVLDKSNEYQVKKF